MLFQHVFAHGPEGVGEEGVNKTDDAVSEFVLNSFVTVSFSSQLCQRSLGMKADAKGPWESPERSLEGQHLVCPNF